MSIRTLLCELRRRDIVIVANGDRLQIEGPQSALTEDIIAQIQVFKLDLLRFLDRRGEGVDWDDDDWHAYFDERAAIREHDGDLFFEEAERLAFEDTVAQWLVLHPIPATNHNDGCVYCGRPERQADRLLPVLARDGHVWVHDWCWRDWTNSRREEARCVLRSKGISATAGTDPSNARSPDGR